jgi:hypothetical protein
VPDAKTVWLCRKALAKAGMVDEIFAQFDGYPAWQGYIARGGQILDGSIVLGVHRAGAAQPQKTRGGRVDQGG